MKASQPSMGKKHAFSGGCSIGDLPAVERKAIQKSVNRKFLTSDFDHASICTEEIGAMLLCFEKSDFERTEECMPEINELHACQDLHKNDPVSVPVLSSFPLCVSRLTAIATCPIVQDPKVLARQWQAAVRNRVFQHFSQKRVIGRLR
jgi:hypothetical protein